jgi:hypothetical protein
MSMAIVRGATLAVWKMLWEFDRGHPDRKLCDRIDRIETTMGIPGSGVVRVQVGLIAPSARDLTDLTDLVPAASVEAPAMTLALQDGWELKRAVALDGHTVQFTLL